MTPQDVGALRYFQSRVIRLFHWEQETGSRLGKKKERKKKYKKTYSRDENASAFRYHHRGDSKNWREQGPGRPPGAKNLNCRR